VCIELDGDFNTEGTEDTVKTRKRGEKEEIRRFTAEGSGDAEDAEKKKQSLGMTVICFGATVF
jgi:hypothetical protein